MTGGNTSRIQRLYRVHGLRCFQPSRIRNCVNCYATKKKPRCPGGQDQGDEKDSEKPDVRILCLQRSGSLGEGYKHRTCSFLRRRGDVSDRLHGGTRLKSPTDRREFVSAGTTWSLAET